MKSICSKIQKEMGIYFYEEASPDIQEHLEECLKCQKQWKTLQETKSYLDHLLPSPSSKSEKEFIFEVKKAVQKKQFFTQKLFWKSSIAASVAMAIWLGFLFTPKTLPSSSSQTSISWLTPEAIEYIKVGGQSKEESILKEENEMTGGGELTWLTPERLELLKYGSYK